jgi:hypothetical protein
MGPTSRDATPRCGVVLRMRRKPLPSEISGRAFSRREAAALGVTSGRLAAADLVAPFHGVRVARRMPAQSTRERCADLLPRLDHGQFFSHATAATLWGMPLPRRFESGDLHVGAIPPGREPRTAGVTGHRVRLDPRQVSHVAGLPVAPPDETWAQLGGLLRLDALVIAADDLLHRGLVDHDSLTIATERLRRRGAVDLRRAIELARPGAESPPETSTRLALVFGGLPEPELNWVLEDAAGGFVARLDLAFPRYRVAVEYDGRHHALAGQFGRDADRWDAIRDEGWLLVRVLSHHFVHPERDVTGRVRRALVSRGWTPSAR